MLVQANCRECYNCKRRVTRATRHLIIEERQQFTIEKVLAIAHGQTVDLGTFRVLCGKCFKEERKLTK